jgi:hypothetical protein
MGDRLAFRITSIRRRIRRWLLKAACTEANVTIPATYNTTYTVVGVNASGFANDSSL